MTTKNIFLILLHIIISQFHISASGRQNPIDINSLFFEVISTKRGLPNSVIRNIEQDSLGFLWMASNDGLIRYDGKRFEVFRNATDNNETLTSNYIPEMHLDQAGNPWILYSRSLDKLDVKTGLVKHHYLQTSPTGQSGMGSTYQFAITPENDFYITSAQFGLLILPHAESSIQTLTKEKEEFPILSTGLDAIKYNNNNLYIGKKHEGIIKVSLSNDKSEILQVEQLLKSDASEFYTIHIDDNQILWAGTSDGIISINLKTKKQHIFKYQPGKNMFLPDKEILSLFTDEWNHLWIGSRENGLSIVSIAEIESRGDRAIGARYAPNDQEGSLSNRSINSIFMDRDKNIWIGTYSGGLSLVCESKNKIHTIGYNPGHPQSLSHPKAWGIVESKDGDLWIGTDGGGIDVWNREKGFIKRFKNNGSPKGLSDNAVLCAMRDSEGSLWFGTYRGGINRINPQTGEIKVYPAVPSPTPGAFCCDIRSIYQDKTGTVWIGTNWNGVCRYDKNSDSFTNIQELGHIDVKAITESNDGKLWIGTHSYGLIWYDPLTKEQIQHYPTPGDTMSLPSNDVYCLKEDSSGKLWIGTQYGGLSCFNPKDSSFTSYSTKQSLANNTVLTILEDQEGYLWLSTNVGISRFDPTTSNFINYDQTNGVLPGEFLNNSCVMTQDGTIFIGGSNGVNYFNPKYIQPSNKTPRVVFTELRIFNEPVTPGNSIINMNMAYNPEIVLTHKQSVFTISFQAIQFPFAEQCQYCYKLVGHDDRWNQVGATNLATYRQVPAGNYQLQVKTINLDGTLSDDTASIDITILPPFWKTTWAYILYAIFIILITYSAFRIRIRQIKIMQKWHLEQEIRIKEKRIHDERLEFFTNISHEIRTPITLMSCSIEDLRNQLSKTNDKSINNAIQSVYSQANKLLDLINRLLEFRRLETSTQPLSIEKIELIEWTSNQLAGFSELAKKKTITLTMTRPFDQIYLWADTNKLSMIVNNLLSNAFKHTPPKGTIEVSIQKKQNVIIMEISDTGSGILPENLPLIFNRYFKTDKKSTSTGIGLAIAKALVELHHGRIMVESAPGRGTKFTIVFLQGEEHFKQNEKETNNLPQRSSLEDHDAAIGKGSTILIIEDNQEIAAFLAKKFAANYNVHIANNGQSGILMAKQIIPDVIISDIVMPDIQGTEVCKELKDNTSTSHIPIILLTAKGSLEDQIVGLNSGADEYISKPFDFNLLEAKVRALLFNRQKAQRYFSEMGSIVEPTLSQQVEISKEQEFIRRLEDLIIQKNLLADTSIEKLAEDLNLSYSSLYRKIKLLTGLSINEFVRSVRIKKAAFFLATEDISVSEAAFKVGYNDIKHFRENFIKQIGETPSAYKKKFRS